MALAVIPLLQAVSHSIVPILPMFTVSTKPFFLIDGSVYSGLLGLSDALVLETDLVATADVIGVTADILSSISIVQGDTKFEIVHDGPDKVLS